MQIKVKEAFNKLWIYPANEEAERFAKLMRRKTFTKADLEALKEEGHSIEILPTYSLEELMKAKNLK